MAQFDQQFRSLLVVYNTMSLTRTMQWLGRLQEEVDATCIQFGSGGICPLGDIFAAHNSASYRCTDYLILYN